MTQALNQGRVEWRALFHPFSGSIPSYFLVIPIREWDDAQAVRTAAAVTG
jgi:hypothetical protein